MFELMEKMYVEFSGKFESMDKRFDSMDKRFENVESDLNEVKQRVINIENDHGKKLSLLFDGYKQNSDKLDRIEAEVTKHEDFILRRVK